MSSRETEGVSSRTKFTSVLETIIILIGLLYRWSIALHPYSGQGKAPMFGDYEAQRHWMEITFNLPLKEWYVNSTRNDLNYWGLDYPPLTAYHSYVMGYIANIVDESYVKLSDSRGIENNQHKLFMRMSVLISDLVVFLPAVLLITRKLVKSSTNDYLILLLLVLLNPTLTLIDYGHFQYNSVSLGLMLLALYFILSLDKQPLCKIKLSIASVFFTLALNYKQMELYHALPFFFFLLGSSLFRSTSFSNGLYKLIVIGSSVLLTFLIVWLPFILSQSALDVLKRLFPFDRGLYEDKVANLWCSLSPVYKLKELYSIATLRNICTITTLGAVVPSSVDLFFRPSRQRFLFALVNSSLVFFLFSYHVHEKSILLATVPALFLINFYPAIVTWLIFIANFSMLPLLHKDGLFTAFVSTTVVFFAIAYLYYNSNSSNDKQQQRREIGFWPNFKQLALFQVTFKSLFYLSMVASVALTFGFLFVRPPKNLPDLWPLLISVFSFVHFVAFSLLFHWAQFTLVYDDLSSKKQPTIMDFSSQLSSKPKQKNL